MMTALVIGSTASHSLEQAYARALRHLGVAVTEFDPECSVAGLRSARLLNRLSWRIQHVPIGRSLLRHFEAFRSYDLVLVFKGMFLHPDVIRSCQRKTQGAVWINVNPDSPFDTGRSTSSDSVRNSIPLYDHYFIWSRALIDPLMKAGARRAHYLPFAHDAAHFPAADSDSTLAKTVVFVGSYDAQRAKILEALNGCNLRIYGNSWDRLPRRSPLRGKVTPRALFGPDLRRVVSSSLASVNILRPQNAGSHNMRTFEVPAMGGVLLTCRSTEQEEFFPDGIASLMYGSPEDLLATAQTLASGNIDTQRIRQQALVRSVGHSYVDRCRDLLAAIGHKG